MSETSEDEQALSQTSEEELSGEEEQDNTDAEEEDDIENPEQEEESDSDADADAEDGKETNAEKELTWKDLVRCSTNIVLYTHFIIMCTCRV